MSGDVKSPLSQSQLNVTDMENFKNNNSISEQSAEVAFDKGQGRGLSLRAHLEKWS